MVSAWFGLLLPWVAFAAVTWMLGRTTVAGLVQPKRAALKYYRRRARDPAAYLRVGTLWGSVLMVSTLVAGFYADLRWLWLAVGVGTGLFSGWVLLLTLVADRIGDGLPELPPTLTEDALHARVRRLRSVSLASGILLVLWVLSWVRPLANEVVRWSELP